MGPVLVERTFRAASRVCRAGQRAPFALAQTCINGKHGARSTYCCEVGSSVALDPERIPAEWPL